MKKMFSVGFRADWEISSNRFWFINFGKKCYLLKIKIKDPTDDHIKENNKITKAYNVYSILAESAKNSLKQDQKKI